MMLGVIQRGRFTGRANWNDAGDFVFNLPLDELLECRLIDLAVTEGRDKRCKGAAKHRGEKCRVTGDRCRGVSDYRPMVPSKTKSAGPVSVTFLYPPLAPPCS